jgi:hypothetical protein
MGGGGGGSIVPIIAMAALGAVTGGVGLAGSTLGGLVTGGISAGAGAAIGGVTGAALGALSQSSQPSMPSYSAPSTPQLTAEQIQANQDAATAKTLSETIQGSVGKQLGAVAEQGGPTLGETTEGDEKRKTVRKKRLGAKKLQIPLQKDTGTGTVSTTPAAGLSTSPSAGLQI